MAKNFVYFQGKCKYPRLVIPDPEFKRWNVNLYFNEKSLAEFKALRLRTHLKMDDDGFYAKLSRPVSKMMRGTNVAFLPPQVFDKDNNPMESTLIGNGSDLTVKCEIYQYTPPGSKVKENAIRLESVRVDHLIPFEPKKDFTDIEAKAAEGLIDQPEQLF